MLKKIHPKLLFCFVMLFSFALFLLLFSINPYGRQSGIFFIGGGDFFADFLNPLIYIRDLSPYFNEVNGLFTKQSLPIVWLIHYPFALLVKNVPPGLFNLWQSPVAMASAVFFVFSCTFFLFFNLGKSDTSKKYNLLILVVLFLSGINIFSMERGNIVILSAGFLALFLNNYKKQDSLSRFLAIFSLSMCGVLKVFPLVFGVLWLYEKRYRDLLYAAALTLVLALVPFFLLKGGFYENFDQALKCVFASREVMGVFQSYPRFSLEHSALLFVFREEYRPIWGIIILFAKTLKLVLAAYSIFLAFFVKEEWKKIALLSLCLIFVPIQSALYTGLYLFSSIILFFNRGEYKKIDCWYMFLFCLFLCPVQFRSHANYLFANAALLFLWLTLLFEQNRLYKKDIGILYGKLFNPVLAGKPADNK